MQLGLDFMREARSEAGLDDQPTIHNSAAMLTPRPYQVLADEGIREKLKTHRSTLLVLPTGCGKTFVFSMVIRRTKGRCLVIAHRDELLQQARRRIASDTGEMVGLEQADFYAGEERIVVASIQTISRPDRLRRWAPNAFELVVVDEAHHATASTYRTVLDHFAGAKVLGVTATPDRQDKQGLISVFESLAYDYEIKDAIEDGYLCGIRRKVVHSEGIDLANVRTTCGDLNQGDLDKVMNCEGVLHDVVKGVLEHATNLRTLVFVTSVEGAHRTAAILNDLHPNSARAVDGGTELQQRRGILRGFEEGEFPYLINVGIATEGYDCPSIQSVALARPTKSRALYTQMVGRGLRIHPSKPNGLLLIDFTGNSGRHDLAGPEDILGVDLPDEVVAKAKAKAKSNPDKSVSEVLAEVKAEYDMEKAKLLAIRAGLQKNVRYRIEDVDPFALLKLDHRQLDRENGFAHRPITEAQLAQLEKYRVPVQPGMNEASAKLLLEKLRARARFGFCTYRQMALLTSKGIPATGVRFNQARELIDALVQNRWKRPEQSVIGRILGKAREPGEEG
jgi:superfamily II DNA or RNA helicase